MKALENNKNIVFLGFDEDTQVLVEYLLNKGYSCFVVASPVNKDNFSGAIQVDENFVFGNADKLDYVVRSRCVDPLNPNVILMREIRIVHNTVSFFFEFFGSKSIFVIGGSGIVKATQHLLGASGSRGSLWFNSESLSQALKNILVEETTTIVLINVEDLIDMGFVPDLILIEKFPRGQKGKGVEAYLRTSLLFSSIRENTLKIIGEDCNILQGLKKEFEGSTFLFSINNSGSDYFIDGSCLIGKKFIPREGKYSISRFKFTANLWVPMTDTQLIQLFALSSVLGLM